MEFGALMHKMVDAACAGDGEEVADCFVEDGVYDDVFYGVFQGRERIVDMIGNYFAMGIVVMFVMFSAMNRNSRVLRETVRCSMASPL